MEEEGPATWATLPYSHEQCRLCYVVITEGGGRRRPPHLPVPARREGRRRLACLIPNTCLPRLLLLPASLWSS